MRRERAHELALSLVADLGRDLLVPDPVAVEADYFIRSRLGGDAARLLLAALSDGEHSVSYLTPGLLRRAVEFDAQYSDLDLGLVDASVMAIAERHELPILTFDFAHFRATRPARGSWRLVVSEEQLARAIA